eukprot:14156564-Ditylum_brightwellii.AAC.1
MALRKKGTYGENELGGSSLCRIVGPKRNGNGLFFSSMRPCISMNGEPLFHWRRRNNKKEGSYLHVL